VFQDSDRPQLSPAWSRAVVFKTDCSRLDLVIVVMTLTGPSTPRQSFHEQQATVAMVDDQSEP
jgi:hypothetical protein